MKYKLEFCPNPDVIQIHLRKRFCSRIALFEKPEDKLEVWSGNTYTEKEPPIYIQRLWEVAGMVSISIKDYQLQLKKGSAFDWNDMIEQIIAILNLELFPDSDPEQLGESIRPSEVLLQSLRKQGCDV